MIEYLKGQLTELSPALAVVECHGVGYGVNISLNTFSALKVGEEVRLWITESIREDAYQLWGFSTKTERDLFLLLTSVSGIGAASARMVLSAMSPSELCDVIAGGDDKMLRQVKGIGPKAAQRIIVDLRDKITSIGIDVTPRASAQQTVDSEVLRESVAALTMLGFSPAPTHKVVQKILQEEPDCKVEQVIKKALKML
ncbi:MAG: Holliday junction branch migration protein RuvA [Bacteroidaceae bacterium]|nr:Holliday junction branch migration protein RuvA [Bacteroidaceae bacterium]